MNRAPSLVSPGPGAGTGSSDLASALPHDGPLPPDPGARGRWQAGGWYVARLLTVAVGLLAVCYGYQLLLGSSDPASPSRFVPQFPWRYFFYGTVFLTASTVLRGRREWIMAAVTLPCVHHLLLTCPQMVPYLAVLVPTLYRLLGSADRPGRAASVRFWVGVGVGIVLLPKCVEAFGLHYSHNNWLDLNQNVFMGLFLRYAYYYYERRRGLVPAGRFWEHVAYLLFVPQITGMLNLPPSEMSDRWGFSWRTMGRGFASIGWALLKIPVVLWLEQSILPAWGYGRGYAALRAAPLAAVWACLLASYLYWALLVSAKFDLMAALFRFFGVDVDDNFRWPLLATSPLELWRRWNVYNRRLLLKFVYFPLGGNRRCVYRNILATFLMSALLLHTGWLGSPWWGVDPGQLRDWLLYFTAQGLVVCAAYWWLNRPFWQRVAADAWWNRPLRMAGWAFTLGCSAWLHVLPLAAGDLLNASAAPIDGLGQRLALMARALGWH